MVTISVESLQNLWGFPEMVRRRLARICTREVADNLTEPRKIDSFQYLQLMRLLMDFAVNTEMLGIELGLIDHGQADAIFAIYAAISKDVDTIRSHFNNTQVLSGQPLDRVLRLAEINRSQVKETRNVTAKLSIEEQSFDIAARMLYVSASYMILSGNDELSNEIRTICEKINSKSLGKTSKDVNPSLINEILGTAEKDKSRALAVAAELVVAGWYSDRIKSDDEHEDQPAGHDALNKLAEALTAYRQG